MRDRFRTAPTGISPKDKEIGIRIQRLNEKARIPTKGSKLAAGHNHYSIEDILIPANNRALVKISLAIAVPKGTYSHIAPRSGLATKGITVDAAVIDADYRGEVKVLLVNYGMLDYKVKIGELRARLSAKNLFLRTDGACFRTNSVPSLRPVLPDLRFLLCLSSLASGAHRRSTFSPQRLTRL